MDDMEADGAAAPERTLITTRGEYLDAFDALIACARRELRVFDPDLEQLRLNAPARVESLRTFLRRSPTTRLHIALHDEAHFARHLPRFAEVATLFSAQVSIQRTDGDAARVQDCFIIADGEHCVRRPVAAQSRGVLLRNDPNETALMRERFDQIRESSTPAAPPTTLGI